MTSVAVVPHTHWDREWYRPFQSFRLRLVELVDELLPRLEAGDTLSHFLLDGQMAAVDDYLAVRPEMATSIRALVESGRLAVGPWYVLMDEFCVSGETIVRDLQLGIDRATALGGHMPVGYLPDMFGHIAQMPQILRLAGFEHAVVWRGVPAAITRTAFRWEAPDGSAVRAEYLPVGYGNGTALPDDAEALVRRIRAHAAEIGDRLLDGILLMNGSDHARPQPWVERVVADANRLQHDYSLRVTSLADYLEGAPAGGLETWRGELRSGARANLLMGVLSNRVDVKQAAAAAERALERIAEPLNAIFRPPAEWPASLLRLAWTGVVRNAAHDSVCACSVDEVVDAVLHRYAESTQIADGLSRQALRALAGDMAQPGAVIVNAAARTRTGTVEVVVPGDADLAGAQLLASQTSSSIVLTGLCGEMEAVMGDLYGAVPLDAGVSTVAIEEDDAGIRVRLEVGANPGPAPTGAAFAELAARAGARPSAPFEVRVELLPFRRWAVRTAPVAGFGWWRWEPVEAEQAVAVSSRGRALDNGLARVLIADDGTFSLNGVDGLNRLVDDGDYGDTYNYSPPPHDSVVEVPEAVEVHVEESGPVRARVRITRSYRWPGGILEGARLGARVVDVTSIVELHAGEPFVRITTSLDNTCRDHRLRAWFPLPSPATASRAECAFAVVERGLTAEGGGHEYGLPTFPSRRFVSAAGVTVVHDGLLEYELVDGGHALALTLLRATGMLSRPRMIYRSRPAGPSIPVEGAQVQGRHTFRYAVAVGDVDPFAMADDVLVPLQVAIAGGGARRPASGSALTVEGAEVSAVVRAGDRLEIRVHNPRDSYSELVVDGRTGDVVDLLGHPVAPFTGRLELRPWEIATVRLT